MLSILKGLVEADDVGVIHLPEDVEFVEQLLLLGDALLLDFFDGPEVAGVALFAGLVHNARNPSPNLNFLTG